MVEIGVESEVWLVAGGEAHGSALKTCISYLHML